MNADLSKSNSGIEAENSCVKIRKRKPTFSFVRLSDKIFTIRDKYDRHVANFKFVELILDLNNYSYYTFNGQKIKWREVMCIE